MPEEAALSRSRIGALITQGAVFRGATPVTSAKAKVAEGETYRLAVPEAADVAVVAQDIPLDVIYEDDTLIVINKPVGMVVHPAPGTPD